MARNGFKSWVVLVIATTAACGVADETAPQEWVDGKGDGHASNAQLAAGVESNLPVELVTRLTIALRQDWVEEHKSHWYSGTVEDEELRRVFSGDADLQREFGDLLGNARELKKVYQALREILHNAAALRRYEGLLRVGRYRDVYASYPAERPELLSRLGGMVKGTPPAGAKPTVVINIPAERLQVFYAGAKYQDNPIVVGRPEYEGYDMNSKTRVGDHTIKEWVHCYSNAEYPSWCDNRSKGAFGKWTAKLDRSYQYIHGTVGSGIVDWFAIRVASGSHGCVRNQNDDIDRLHDIAPEGSWVRKIYVRTERTASVKSIRDDNRSTGPQDEDLFGQDLAVSFHVKKHDNLYDYDTGHTPSSVPQALRIPERPNGVYYPDTGVTVGYADPPDAMIAEVQGSTAAPGARCTARGGVCMAVRQCGGTPVGGLCPGDSSIQCCTP